MFQLESDELSQRQIAYAATDAWIGRLIFLRMRELGLVPVPQHTRSPLPSPARRKPESGA